ncbi:MAG: NUDIX hydrolase [Dehalococcoidia bacterium]|nr:NUDIX hydrolase [Dehalococcoidia bacterium]
MTSASTAVALLIHHPREPGQILVVKRPEGSEEELPGIWGLPAATCRANERPKKAARRAARQKLGVSLRTLRPVAEGVHQRPQGPLAMTLFEAVPVEDTPTLPIASHQVDGFTYYTEWRWAPLSILEEGAAQGSLCCALALGLA